MNSSEATKCYGYGTFGRVIKGVIDILVIAFFMPFLTMPFWMAVVMVQERTLWPHAILLSLVSAAFSVIMLTAMLNQVPVICVTSDYLEATLFTVLWIKIPWSAIAEIRRSQLPNYRGWVVVTKKATPLHYVLGWVHLRSLVAAVPIPRGIRECDDLLREIRRRSGAMLTD